MWNLSAVKQFALTIGTLYLIKCSHGDKEQTAPGHIPIYSPWTRHLGLWNETKSDLIKLMKYNRYLYPRIMRNFTGGGSNQDLSDEPIKNAPKHSSLWERTYRIPPFPNNVADGVEDDRKFDDWYNTNQQIAERERTQIYLRSIIKTHQENINLRELTENAGIGTGNRIIKKSDKSSSTSVVAAVIIFLGILSLIIRIAGRAKSSGALSESRRSGELGTGTQDEMQETAELSVCRIISRRRGSAHAACHSNHPEADWNSESSNEREPISLVSCFPSNSILLHNNRARINGSTIVIIRRKSGFSDPPPPYPGYPSNFPPATTSDTDSESPPPYPGVTV